MRERDELRSKRLQQLRSEVQVAADELDRGDSSPFDAPQIKAEIRKRLDVESANH
ncbi:MAG TPA: hypothetical protein VFI31_16010 [Pirellulales bacterium]|nr:hypothetical protein [Pirellulales bacterium]